MTLSEVDSNHTPHYTAQLRCFLATVGPATLKNVTLLQLIYKPSLHRHNGLIPEAAAIARLIGASCPNLTHLTTEDYEADAVVLRSAPYVLISAALS